MSNHKQIALRSGIDANSQVIYNETPAALDQLKNEYRDRFCPTTPEQRMLVDTLIDCEWLLRRFRRIEAQLWDDGMNNQIHKSILGEAFRKHCDVFTRLQRRIDSTQRHYNNALRELERLQAVESAQPADPEPLAVPSIQTPQPRDGFDPPTVPARPPESPETPPPAL